MDLQLTLADKSMLTVVTEPWFASLRMTLLLVSEKTGLDWKSAATEITYERPFTAVDPAKGNVVECGDSPLHYAAIESNRCFKNDLITINPKFRP